MPGTLWTVSASSCSRNRPSTSLSNSATCSLRAITSLAGVGDYRVVYTAEDGQLIVWVLAVGNRRDIYRQVP
ncbi:type II toxin-antitoxin system RelE/ParE family toxin [Streptomyces sp. ActVer]|uniref:type II toxin-antitoxin system RelE family toxin n=1 Tax=Streptomyces sp. ActVer TaxID=3014558 RepID=UPI0022B4E68D|nr:type II toxin-antitoxin system RelE/ParE family toxin [Streptomyces sp. ActVer]MCZ4507376.1 type II toxin-antitoxin system RelE/ParE family toxin [Streptomyces sp. ActVer]